MSKSPGGTVRPPPRFIRDAGLVALLFLVLLAAFPALGSTLTLDVLDVGQGDSLLIRTDDGRAVLIDAGDGKTDVAATLNALGVLELDLVVATHPHADHIGGMAHVIDEIPVKNYMDNGFPHTTQVYESLMQKIEQRDITYLEAMAGRKISLGKDAMLEVLWPAGVPLRNTRSDLNANSVVLRLTHEGHCMLLTGDAEEPTETRLMMRDLPPCDVLKVAHHGGNHSTTDRFIDAVSPRFALISVGVGNTYGHPGTETLSRLERHGVLIYRTDQSGTLRVVSSPGNLEVLEGMSPMTAAQAVTPGGSAHAGN